MLWPTSPTALVGIAKRIRLLLLVVGCLYAISAHHHQVTAQQEPSWYYATPAYNSSTNRQNLCNRSAAFANGDVDLQNALQGLELRPLISVKSSEYFRLKTIDGGGFAIDETNPGVIAVLLDELARRAGFTWRDSYGYVSNGPGENHTWSDLLQWATDTYDFNGDWVSHSVEHLKMGVVFPTGFYDASIVLVGLEGQKVNNSLNLLNWSEPFELEVWVMCVATVILSAFVYMFLEWIGGDGDDYTYSTREEEGEDADHRDWKTRLGDNLYTAALSATSNFDYVPTTGAGRLFALSVAFWALLISSTYTANLASFYVETNSISQNVVSIEGAIQAKFPVCVIGGTYMENHLAQQYPKAKLVRTTTYEELFQGVRDGDCVFALLPFMAWAEFQQSEQYNVDCKLVWVGTRVFTVQAGFATIADYGGRCTSLIRDVLDLHMLDMTTSGFVHSTWMAHLKNTSDVVCKVFKEEDVSDRLSGREMAGTFLLHFVLSMAAISVAVIAYFNKKKKFQSKREGQESEVHTQPKEQSGGAGNTSTGTGRGDGLIVDVAAEMEELVNKMSILSAKLNSRQKEGSSA